MPSQKLKSTIRSCKEQSNFMQISGVRSRAPSKSSCFKFLHISNGSKSRSFKPRNDVKKTFSKRLHEFNSILKESPSVPIPVLKPTINIIMLYICYNNV